MLYWKTACPIILLSEVASMVAIHLVYEPLMPWCKDSFLILGFYLIAFIPKYHPKPDTLFFLNSLLLLKILTMQTSEKIQNSKKFYYRITS